MALTYIGLFGICWNKQDMYRETKEIFAIPHTCQLQLYLIALFPANSISRTDDQCQNCLSPSPFTLGYGEQVQKAGCHG